jgi:hypothetical protein
MDRKVVKNRASSEKAAVKRPVPAGEPFAQFAEPLEIKARAERTTAVPQDPIKRGIRAAKKAAPRFLASEVADPFASIANDTASLSKTPKAAAKRAAKKAAAKPAVKKAETKPASPRKAKLRAAAPDVPTIQPVTDPAPEPSSEPAILPPTDPTYDPVPQPIIEPVPDPSDNPDPAPVSDPPLDPGPVYSAAFKLLAEPALPELPRANRARLQMQTPTRIYFYWSLRQDPWTSLRRVFGNDTGSYTLVIKLIDQTAGREEIVPAEADGNYWFDVEPNRLYQAEVGFYAPNRPYFRIIHSNTVETPRRSPSPRAATESDWKVTAEKFAEVLDVAGFSRDAADVAMAGDDVAASTTRTNLAFTSFIGTDRWEPEAFSAEELRHAMLTLAAGKTLEELKFRVSADLFAVLQTNAGSIGPAKAMNALTQYFDIDDAEFAEEQIGPAVFGASLVNFPKTLRTKTLSPKYAPVSSHSIAH